VKAAFGKAARPKKPFLREHIVAFMSQPLALCCQQLLRGAERFELNGSNVIRHPNFFMVEVDSSKNIPDGFSFKLHVKPERPHCVRMFLADYVARMGVLLGDNLFACKIRQTKGVLSAVPSSKVTNSTMRSACKKLIKAVGMDSSEYASHSCKRGAALAALEAGLSQVQVQDLGGWASSAMVVSYAGADPAVREALADVKI
jgi:hypothetical protein